MDYFGKGIYDGYWKNNLKEGLGLFIWPNGDEYNGNWEND